MVSLHIAARQNFQRREKFVAEIVLTATDTGQRGGRTDHRALADLRAIIGFNAPDGGDEVAIDAIRLLDRVEGGAVLSENRPAILDAVFVHQNVEVIPDRFGELRLGIEQIHDPQIGREAGDVGLEHRARDAAALGLRPE